MQVSHINIHQRVKELHSKEDSILVKLESKMSLQGDKILTADTKEEALQEALSLEYMIISTRTKINEYLSNTRNLLAQDIPPLTQSLLRQREQQLILRGQRLSDLREDLNSLQKLAYTLRQAF